MVLSQIARHQLEYFFFLSLMAFYSFAEPAFALPGLDYQTETRIYDALDKAHDLIAADRYNEAKPLLESATRHDPSRYSGNLHENLAIVYRELGYPEKAISHAKIAMSYGGSPGISYTLGLCYSDMGEFEEAERWLQRFIIDTHDPQFQQQARDMIRDMQQDSNRVKPGSTKKRDYFDDIITNKEAQRWRQTMVPLKLYIASGKGIRNYRPTYRRLILEAMDAWCSASGNKLSYKVINDKSAADIDVEWVGQPLSTVDKDRKRDAAGLTTVQADDKSVINHALVQIETYDIERSSQATDSKIKSACLHEIGHAVGVGHSPYVKDIMYFKITPRQLFNLSPRDRATVAKLYTDYPVVTLVTGTSALPPECFAQPSLPPGVMRYPPIPSSFFAQPSLPPPPKQHDDNVSSDSSSLFAQPGLPKKQSAKSSSRPSTIPATLFAQPGLPLASKKPIKSTSSEPLFATPTLPKH